MGLFSRLFGSPSSIEKQLKNIYVPMFQTTMGMSRSQAKRFFRHTLKRVKELSLKQGSINLPQNFGDILLEKESTDEKTKVMLAKKRKEGVRDEDIRWWWNMHDFERGMMSEIDNTTRTTMFIDNIAEGMKEEEAAARVRKYHPIYGDPDDTSTTTGEDRPLPYELKNRVNIYIEKRTQSDPGRFKKDIEESSSFNALVRKEIKRGNV